jgi:hypothetical protein
VGNCESRSSGEEYLDQLGDCELLKMGSADLS